MGIQAVSAMYRLPVVTSSLSCPQLCLSHLLSATLPPPTATEVGESILNNVQE